MPGKNGKDFLLYVQEVMSIFMANLTFNHFYSGPAGGGGVRQPQAHGQLRLQPSGQNKGQHIKVFADF